MGCVGVRCERFGIVRRRPSDLGVVMHPDAASQHAAVLAALRARDSRLRRIGGSLSADAEGHRIEVFTDVWRTWLRDAGTDARVVDHLLDPIKSGSVSRRDVRKRAGMANDPRALRQLLVTTLAWGMGRRNARMLPGIMRLLASEQLDEALDATAVAARAGRPAVAYRSWQAARLPGLREPFFTKWLWAASHTGPRVDGGAEWLRCLTLDGRVWRTLGSEAHRWSSVTAAGTRVRAERYEAYAKACHLWAEELGVTPEDVEFALFDAGGDLVPPAADRSIT